MGMEDSFVIVFEDFIVDGENERNPWHFCTNPPGVYVDRRLAVTLESKEAVQIAAPSFNG